MFLQISFHYVNHITSAASQSSFLEIICSNCQETQVDSMMKKYVSKLW